MRTIYNITQYMRLCTVYWTDCGVGGGGGEGCSRRRLLARKRVRETTLYIFVSRTSGGWHDEAHPSSGNNAQHLLYWFRSLATVPRRQFKLNATMIMIFARTHTHTRPTHTYWAHILHPNIVFADPRRSFRKDL